MLSVTRLLTGNREEMDELRYGRHAAAPAEQERPVVVWNVTRRCNLRCVHCYASASDRADPKELTTEEGFALIDSLGKVKVPVLLLSGGEPLIRADILPLAERATKKGLRVVVSTNGTLITNDLARSLKNAGVRYVGISLDGLEERHNRFRRRRGVFREALRGIHACQHVGLKVGVRFTMTRDNFEDLPGLLDLVKTEGIPRFCLYHLVYSGRATDLADRDLAAWQKREIMDLLIDTARELGPRGVELLTVDNHADGPYLYLHVLAEDRARAAAIRRLLQVNGGNASGSRIACVDERGYVHPDQFWRHAFLGNVRERPFSEIWWDETNELLQALRHRKGLLKGRCARCRFLDLCNGNFRVRAEAATGDLWAPDPSCYLTDEEISSDNANT